MPISYPLDIPSTPGFKDLVFRAVSIAGQTRSEFTGQQHITLWPGEWWEVDCSLPIMDVRADAEAWITFLLMLRGISGTFLLGPEQRARTAQGTASGVTINGAGQAGTTLALNGSGTLKKGDYIQLSSGSGARLHKVLQDITLAATADIFPRLRESPTNGSAVVIASPKGVFRLAENQAAWELDEAQIYGLRFRAVEGI